MPLPTTRPLGHSGIQVPTLCFGTNILGWTVDEPTSFTLLDHALANGLNFLDTADVYSNGIPGHVGGESETIIGHWMKSRNNRDHIILATKCGIEMSPTDKGLSKAYIMRAVENSLRRLQTNHIDLYQAHRDDPNTPLEETMDAFGKLVQDGKVRALGASNYTAPRLAAALQISKQKCLARFESLQPHYNLAERPLFEPELEPLCQKEHLAVIPYFSLASGFLTGKYRTEADLTKSPRGQGVKKYLTEKGLKILTALDQISSRLQTTPARVALAWLIARPSITAPIASATTIPQLDDLIASTKLHLDAAAIESLTTASS